MKSFPAPRPLWIVLSSILILTVLGVTAFARGQQPDPLRAALEAARDAGSYAFVTDVTQVVMPTGKVTNIGRSSTTTEMHLEGETNVRAPSAQMRLWMQGGSVADPAGAIGIKVEDGATYVRQGEGEWREQDAAVDGFAPGGDFMTYLAALRDPVAHPPETRNGVRFTRYTFRLDGPALATYFRDQAEASLRRRAELPPGAQLETPAYYRDMVGDGELWVGGDGLPLRQVVRMRFPEQRDAITRVEIVVNYSHFGEAAGAMAATGGGLRALLGQARSVAGDAVAPVAAALGVLGFCVLLLRQRDRIWPALVITLVILMVVGPLLNSVQAARAAETMAARTESQEWEQEEMRQAEEARAALSQPAIDPHADPLVAAARLRVAQGVELTPEPATTEPAGGAVVPGDLVPQSFGAASEPAGPGDLEPALAPEADDDGDGLTNFEERSVGTDPTYADSDEDLISDLIEVRGFTLSDQTWFMDPIEPDSNKDGVSDTIEYDFNNDGQPDDTDNDGTPDVFDRDNDDDGVPDAKDLAPFTGLSTVFTGDAPLRLKLEELTPNTPTFVDFQIRPVNPKHLWYAFNVLDWPTNDSAGHIQDRDGATFGSVMSGDGQSAPSANDFNGDMKLLPMLEITMDASSANLPDAQLLKPYNIRVNRVDEAGTRLVAYVPLSLVTDEQTGERVAFSARMRYTPATANAWITAHEVRLVWLVQMLNEVACDPTQAEDIWLGCDATGIRHNTPAIVQSYGDEWRLTGLNVMEDHGARVAVVYEDPTGGPDADPNLTQDDALAALSFGLNKTFLEGRDLNGDKQLDVNLDEIVRRFDRTTNAGVSEVERWAVPNYLRTDLKTYATADEAVMTTAMTETLRILSYFTAPWQANPEIKPLLMYAQEASSRSLGLDAMAHGQGWVAQNGTELTLNLHPQADKPAAPVIMVASVKWMPYCTPEGGAPSWSPCSVEAWWETLAARQAAPVPGDPDDADIAAGRVAVMNHYHGVLMQGVSNVVLVGGEPQPQDSAPEDDESIMSTIGPVVKVAGPAVKFMANKCVLERIRLGKEYSFLRYLRDTGGDIRNFIRNFHLRDVRNAIHAFRVGEWLNRGGSTTVAKVAVVAAVAVVWGVWALGDGELSDQEKAVTIGFAKLAMSAYTAYSFYKSVSRFANFKTAFLDSGWRAVIKAGSAQSVLRATRAAAIVGAAIDIAVTWGFFIAGVVADQVQVFSQEFNQAMAQAIAATIYAIIMLVLAFSIIGTAVAIILALLDAVLAILCETGFWESLKQNGVCFSISGTIVQGFAQLIYNYASMVETGQQDLLQLGVPQMTLAAPAKGLVHGNSLTFTMPVTSTVHHHAPTVADGPLIAPYVWLFYTPDILRSATVKATISSPTREDLRVDRYQMSPPWTIAPDDGRTWLWVPMYRGSATTSATSPSITLAAGINRSLPVHLNYGYAFPAYECWNTSLIVGYTPLCYIRTLSGNDSEVLTTFKLDVLPATLDGFMSVSGPAGGSQSMTWASNANLSFPPLKDADGDGLSPGVSGAGGLDPDDTTADADRDCLTDGFELQQGQEGVGYSPQDADTDDDGLTDLQEALYGTAPDRADTDRDGLTDGEEVVHQPLVYDAERERCHAGWGLTGGWWITVQGAQGPYGLHVGSDPLARDGDGDGISDKDERAWSQMPGMQVDNLGYPFNPNVPNEPWLSVTVQAFPKVIWPGASLTYTTTAVANIPLHPSPLKLELGGALLTFPSEFVLPFNPVGFTKPQTVTQVSTLHAVPYLFSEQLEVGSRVTGQVDTSGGWTGPSQIEVTGVTTVLFDGVRPTAEIKSVRDGEYLRGKAGDPLTRIIGGTATDELTGIQQVEVSLDSGAWQVATGGKVWTYPLTAGDSRVTLTARATDWAGNVGAPSAPVNVLVDGRPPAFDFSGVPGNVFAPPRQPDGRWAVTLGGAANDPPLTTGQAGSGIDAASLRVRLISVGRPTEVVGDWLPAALTGSQWSSVYPLPAQAGDPTGSWVVEVAGADNVGNESVEKWPGRLRLDVSGPSAAVRVQDMSREVLTPGTVIRGVISDTLAGIDRLDVAFSPLREVAPLHDAALWLSFDESTGSTFWEDRSGQGNGSACVSTGSCPRTDANGRSGGGLQLVFEPPQSPHAAVARDQDLNVEPGQGLTAMAWVNVGYGATVQVFDYPGAYKLMVRNMSQAAWQVYSEFADHLLAGGPSLSGGWHHLAGVIDSENGELALYVDGKRAARAGIPVGGAFRSEQDLTIGLVESVVIVDPFSGAGENVLLDEAIILRHAATADEVDALYQAGLREWLPAVLSRRGEDAGEATWSVLLPAGLEGLYQVNLRSRDVLGNVRNDGNAWRTTIDTLAPRVSLAASLTGTGYVNPYTDRGYAAVHVVCTAEDLNLDAARLNCPKRDAPPARRSSADGRARVTRSFTGDSALQSLLPDRVLSDGITSEWAEWWEAGPMHKTMDACDRAGNCATSATDLQVAPPANGSTIAVVTWPPENSLLISSGTFTATVVARSTGAIFRYGLRFDGTPVFTVEVVKPASYFQRTEVITAGEGRHTLQAWTDGEVAQYPITVDVDLYKPTVAITTEAIGPADVYGTGNTLLRFRGVASDTVCLEKVELSVDGGPFVECAYANGEWTTTYFVNAPEGRSLLAEARATDCAGRESDLAQKTIPTNLVGPNPPDTQLLSTPPNPSGPNGVTFAFVGENHPEGRQVAGLMCRLDKELYGPCASPATYNRLRPGQHTFYVRAVDVGGNVDPSPATYTWDVKARVYLPIIR